MCAGRIGGPAGLPLIVVKNDARNGALDGSAGRREDRGGTFAWEKSVSQYPSPYLPPQVPIDYSYYQPAGDLLQPARRASIVLFVLAGLGLACGILVGISAWVSPEQLLRQPGMETPEIPGSNLTPEQILRITFTIAAVIMVLGGIVFGILGLFVRRGGKGSAITGVVLGILLLLWLAVNGVSAFFITANLLAGIFTICIVGVLGPLIVMMLMWLFQAIKAAPMIRYQRQQFEAQRWQYQQQQMAYLQSAPPGGYGYGTPPPQQPPTPQASPPPPVGSEDPNAPSSTE